MSQLANQHHELYAQFRAKGFAATKAAVAAGYSRHSSIYVQLDRRPEVIARVEQLSSEISAARAQRAAEMRGVLPDEICEAWVLRQMVGLVADAREQQDFKSANAVLVKIGEHLGMWSKPPDSPPTAPPASSHAVAALERLGEALSALDAPTPPKPSPDVKAIQALVGHSATPHHC
jgi:hypothetical protein